MKQKLKTLLFPHPWALFEIHESDEDIAICIDQQNSNYAINKEIGIFELGPLMRVLLKKANICKEEYINNLTSSKTDQMGIILNWERERRLVLLLGPIKENLEEQKILSGLDSLRSSLAASQIVGTEEKGRLFPRYDVSNLPTSVEIENVYEKVLLKEIGAGGVKLESQSKLEKLSEQIIKLKIKDQIFHMKLFLAWEKLNTTNQKYEAGFTLNFDKKEDFEKWFILTKALHRLKSRKRNKDDV